MRLKLTTGLLSFLCLTACGQSPYVAQSSTSSNSVAAVTPTTPSTPSTPVSPSGGTSLNICSVLNLNNLTWPSQLADMGREAMALSMNITGSYEGISGWDNITGNFDGQGMSLGLLQQNLGQGTLQPLMLQLRANDPKTWASFFTAAQLASVNQMLNTWQSSTGTVITAAAAQAVSAKRALASVSSVSEAELFPDSEHLSSLDVEDSNLKAQVSVKSSAVSASQTSVAWAVDNILSSTDTISTSWKTALQAMANSAEYRSIQVATSLKLYDTAAAYYATFGFKEIRSMILMYDFVVQDGGFSASQKSQFEAYSAANPNASETQRAEELLTIRLSTVLAAYQADVKSRKMTIINGTGVVHGTTRNLPVQYCYNPSQPY